MTCMASSEQWINAFAKELGVNPPSAEEREAILFLAGTAARSSERTAAPVACWLVAKAGVELSVAQEIALRLSDVGDETNGASA
jgi:hypothetical protein